MKTQKSILLAFLLNLGFSLFEFAGGLFTGSMAILSDAVHDLSDAASIGISYLLEKKSKRPPDDCYTYGYARFSALGGGLTALMLLLGSALVVYNALRRIVAPTPLHYNGMILFAVIGVAVNLCAALITRKGDSVNLRAVNLHMLEDVLGWAVVLVGALIMKLTDIPVLDSLLSIGVAAFISLHAVGHLKEVLQLFLERVPAGLSARQVLHALRSLPGITDVHHLHLWSIDGHTHCATAHIVTDEVPAAAKQSARQALQALGITHVTLELEVPGEHCHSPHCHISGSPCHHHHH